uniref:Protein a4 n=1 Tax=Mastomys natalensis cytomegalovirus 2 TaxID=2973540 RepID=A0A9Y1N7N3_9BETA|nr:protein a4 [Mastomys natalensis cytomegalovirus 2]
MSRCPRGEGGWCAGTLTVPRTRAYGLCAFTFALGACTAALSTVLALRPVEHGCVPESRTPGRSAPGSPEPCPEGWLTFLDRCFYLSTAVAGWEDARNYCLRHDADLIRPQTTAELIFLVQSMKVEHVWTGLHHAGDGAPFVWADGTPSLVPLDARGQYCFINRQKNRLFGLACGHPQTTRYWSCSRPRRPSPRTPER